ncbi:hypothetical protein TNCV_303101 [Trichonephila clavipes]|nr:hypothetical protein TNCV_303101 [Trichonephila clavipes]
MPVVSRSFEHHACDRTILLSFTPIWTENTLGVFRGLSPLFPFQQPHERACGSTVIKSTPMQRSHNTFTNNHVFSGIRILSQRLSSHRR